MNSPDSDIKVRLLVEDLTKHKKLEIAARERDATIEGNRHVERTTKIIQALAESPRGRDALEQLLTHEMPEIRLLAASRILAWSPDMAVPVLGSLLVSWRPRDPKRGSIPVAFYAALALYRHFGIKDFDRNKLIEPMRAYGIDIPRRPD